MNYGTYRHPQVDLMTQHSVGSGIDVSCLQQNSRSSNQHKTRGHARGVFRRPEFLGRCSHIKTSGRKAPVLRGQSSMLSSEMETTISARESGTDAVDQLVQRRYEARWL